ncbi:hypothetical protein EVAR_94850_1 [Eumeta japonica]|uniref:Uncharacterized protein n=1 Tax=Eumeta variegata TaxID=151549 RepID=A0A4C1V9Z5_EUMVA|nr:hypothetical protein EVAR_94850_1 [Eumeta japonica]
MVCSSRRFERAETKATSHARGTWRPQTFAISPPLTRPGRSRHLNDLLITIWTSRLPQNIQTVIAGQTAPTLELLADLADRVHEIAPPSLQVACTSTVSAHASTLENLTSEIAELRRQMRQLTTHSYRQLRPRSRGHPQGRSRSKSCTRSDSSYRKYPTCWYHSRYANKANKCVKPCDFKAENTPGSR